MIHATTLIRQMTAMFGKPKKPGKNSAEYTAMYNKNESDDEYVIYTGLTVFYGADKTVEKYGYFEIKSN